MAASAPPTRWGILCAGRISQDFTFALNSLPAAEHKVVAVAARSAEAAEKFAANYGIPKFYGSYEELVQDPYVDVVYIGAIGPQHLPLSKLALDHRKHVLCEKPLCMNSAEAKELIEYARSKNRFLMEAIWSRFFPSYHQLRQELVSGAIGEPKQVVASLSLRLDPTVDRSGFRNIGRGSLHDVGVYCVQLATLVFGADERPLQILAAGHLNEGGVDESTSTTLIYSGGRAATLLSHYSVALPCDGVVAGTKGTIKLCAKISSVTKLETPTRTYEFELPTPEGNASDSKPSSKIGLSYEAQEVRRCILNGQLESPLMTHSESILIAEIMDSIRRQVGVTFPQDRAYVDH